ncbi:MAG: methylenetetrahydrofolate reductase [Elusimicrobiota bacterium]
MKIDNILKRKKTISFEFFPPKDIETFKILIETIKELKNFNPDFISVTDSNISAKMKHIALSKLLKEKMGLNMLIHLTCINNTPKEIKTSIKAIEKTAIDNILALRGDKRNFIKISNYFKHATDLMKEIDKNKFCIVVAAHPEGHRDGDIKKEIFYLKMKKEMGARVAVTQIFFDNEVFFKFREKFEKEIGIFLIPGIMTITKPKMFENII